ncbi:uncharacterized protein LOC132200171 [Neocloeon triangulifer]|uniref:uncharacterized protein LOC132200171 n=1 Tax=Neocloeon triangulifer TaxID=2078957 RepID=UPI00286F8A43|nr:uncharacterized protein LOC132200171 [Neocloeon triangulifer]
MPDTAANATSSSSASAGSAEPRVHRGEGVAPPQLPLSPVTDLPKNTVQVPSSPPPSYEEVLAENRLVAAREAAAAAASASAGACGGSDQARGSTEKPPVSSVGRTGPLQIQHKSSKALYRAVAAQWGLTCKMSDKCRCLDCQGRYFDCEYEQNEQEKTDGGLGAGTPMFISDVMGGSVGCTLL